MSFGIDKSITEMINLIKVSINGGAPNELPDGISAVEAIKQADNALLKSALAVSVNGEVKDLSSKLESDCEIEVVDFQSPEGKKVYWHTCAHIMAQAVKRLFPDVKLAIGPAIKNGFYYDFDKDVPFSDDDLSKIEQEINKIIKENLKIERFELDRDKALDLEKSSGEPYKIELIEDLPSSETISFYKQGEFADLCRGPHLQSTGKVKSVKLLSSSGAYWRGSEKNKMLQRIYGISFDTKSALDDYLNMLQEAKKRDHKKLGKELELFMTTKEGPGFPFFLPKGMVIRNALEDYWREIHSKNGYVEIKTPVILNEELWHRSGHWDHYKDNMYTTKIDGDDYGIKPMNCPGSVLVYGSKMHSYKDLPIRFGELGLVHRHEKSGELNGLFRVRCFTQDDAHIFCLPEQIESEVKSVIKLVDEVYSRFGFRYTIELSTRPENSIGSDELWEKAENALKKVLEDQNLQYELNEGDGAFYGPKIDFHVKDCLGRDWQCGTVQLDFQMPERFDLVYIGEDGNKHRPVMLHRVIFGSMERFIGIIIEHYAGAFPVWLAPVQVAVLPISEKHFEYGAKIKKYLDDNNIRASMDGRQEKIGYKIRSAQMDKVPYMLILGDKELEAGNVSVRSCKNGDVGSLSLEDFLSKIRSDAQNNL